MGYNADKIRNFSIIAHIDHGKSTLADRLLEKTDSVAQRDMREQLLDNMDLEKERGITIKARAVKLNYKAKDGENYEMNLIDTPGHVDFNYEVSRSLAACEGALLVVDSTQGIQAQTLANTYLALENDLEIIPVINKIDLPSARTEDTIEEIENVIGIEATDAPLISAKTGKNIEDVLEAVVNKIPSPSGVLKAPLKALVFDSMYDPYKGVIVYVRVRDGEIKKNDRIKFMATGAEFDIVEIGYLQANSLEKTDSLKAGEVGYLTASIKNIESTRVGDTITLANNPAKEPLPGYKEVNPAVFCGVYPSDGEDYEDLKETLEKLKLNDASLFYEPETSKALGFGFRCGFLGLLHLEITKERIDREYDIGLITTVPSVIYKIELTNGELLNIDNPCDWPDTSVIKRTQEPISDIHIYTPPEYIGTVMGLCQDRRGEYIGMTYLTKERVDINYKMPLNEIIFDFFDALKSATRGYASFDYENAGYRESKLVKLDVLLNSEVIDALSFVAHESKAQTIARKTAIKLKKHIPRQMFEVPVQVAIGSKIIARETVKAMRKDVLSKCYGGDITRKRKLLEKQKEGKKRMKKFGNIEIPQEAFLSILKLDDDE
ncbi:MAG: translation elongation factor 4 [Clostridia bacterium]|nr:translation elongation factor 4 [Clostridia bacterium]